MEYTNPGGMSRLFFRGKGRVSLRQAMDSVPKMLCFLSEHHHISLLRNYRCLRTPP